MKVVEPSFALGELADALSGRVDMEWYGKGLARCRNFYVMPEGGVTFRPGTEYVGDVPTMNKVGRLVPFMFNSQTSNTYAILFNNGKGYPIQDGAFVYTYFAVTPAGTENPSEEGWYVKPLGGTYTLTTDTTVVSGTTYYNYQIYSFDFEATDTALAEMRYIQSGDTLYMVHSSWAPRKVVRYGHDDWRVSNPTFMPLISAPTSLTATTSATGSVEYTYVVTAVNADGDESAMSDEATLTSKDLGLDNTTITLTWMPSVDATEYKIYKDVGGTFGLVGYALPTEVVSGGTVINIQSGATTGTLLHYSATRRYVVWNNLGTVTTDSQAFTVATDSDQNAFLLDGKLFVYCTETTGQYDMDSESGCWEGGTETTHYWAVIASPHSGYVGTYTSSEYVEATALGTTSTHPQGTYGVLNIEPVIQGATQLTWKDKNYEADTSVTPLTFENPFSGTGNYPSCVGFIQQRLVFANSTNDPQKIWLSRSGNFENFGRSNPTQDDDAIYMSLYSRQSAWIRSLVSLRCLIALTGGTEYSITGNGTDAVITPATIRANQQSAYGSSQVEPEIVGNSILILQRGGHVVRDMTYDYSIDGYQGSNLSIRSQHFINDYTIKAWAYQTTPDGVLWCVRSDGELLSMTYNREHQIYAWAKHTTDGTFEDVCCVRSNDRDEIYFIVKRTVNGTEKRYVERLAERFTDLTSETATDAWYVDSGLRLTSDTAVSSISGLGHLEGKTVSVLADGAPITGLTVSNGSITLPSSYNVVLVGLPYTGYVQSLRVNTQDQYGISQGRKQKIGNLTLRLDRSIGGDVGWKRYSTDGSFLEDKWVSIKYRTLQTANTASEPFSGDKHIVPPTGWDDKGQFMLRQTNPLPLTLLCVILNQTMGE